MGAASLVLGIISLLIVLIPLLPDMVGIILGIIGIILGAIGKKNGSSCATGGLVISIIATVIGLIFYIACAAAVSSIL